MNAIKGFWKHKNGKIYAIISDTFGNIIGGVGPLEPENLQSLVDHLTCHAITRSRFGDTRSAINARAGGGFQALLSAAAPLVVTFLESLAQGRRVWLPDT